MSNQQQKELDKDLENSNVAGGWGEQLRETRIRRGLSVEDVSNSLHLEYKLIVAIEAEDLNSLPGSSFVKGYLRNYARLLDMDHQPLINAYAKICGNDDPVLTQVAKFKEASSKDAAPRSATWLVVIVLVVSLGIWWWSEIKPSSTAVEVDSNSVTDSVQTITPEPEVVVTSEPEVFDIVEQEVVVTAKTEVVAEVLEEETTVVIEDVITEKPLQSTIKLTVEQDSWIEITDAQGKRLFMDIVKAGQNKTIDGDPPFKVLLGNAPGVTVEFNDEVYGHAKHNRKGVARFTLGE